MPILVEILANYGPRPALWLNGEAWSYAAVIDAALRLAAVLDDEDPSGGAVCGVLAHKSALAYIAPLASLLAGRGYLPLNVKFPARRLAAMIRRSGTRTIVAGSEAETALAALLDLPGDGPPLTVIAGGREARHGRHRILPLDRAATTALSGPRPHRPGATAYLMFTSGSTGEPKGVAVSHANLEAYLDHVRERFPLEPDDRASQSFDLTFDLSVHDIFATWRAGACLYPLADATVLAPARFIRETGLTAWFSVPSVAMFMARTHTLRPGLFPSLRLSLFCGEPLPVATAQGWAAAAPGSRIVNLYGPTEATIAIAAYEWDRRNALPPSGIVPLGRVFPGQRHRLRGEDGQVVPRPGRGELCLAGTQVTAGYLDSPDKTAFHYVRLPGEVEGPWYRTGDLVEEDGDGRLHYLGRLDFQVKVNGYRVELGEIETVLRAASGCEAVVALPWPESGGTAQGLVAVILGAERDSSAILRHCRDTLPAYMVPAAILWTDTLPLNGNGKIDRQRLAADLDQVMTAKRRRQ